MKQSVSELLQLVEGNHQANGTGTTAPSLPARKIRSAAPLASQPAPVHGNGNGRIHAAPATSGQSNDRSEIPLEGDFRDF